MENKRFRHINKYRKWVEEKPYSQTIQLFSEEIKPNLTHDLERREQRRFLDSY